MAKVKVRRMHQIGGVLDARLVDLDGDGSREIVVLASSFRSDNGDTPHQGHPRNRIRVLGVRRNLLVPVCSIRVPEIDPWILGTIEPVGSGPREKITIAGDQTLNPQVEPYGDMSDAWLWAEHGTCPDSAQETHITAASVFASN